jgi:hypothetical protein
MKLQDIRTRTAYNPLALPTQKAATRTWLSGMSKDFPLALTLTLKQNIVENYCVKLPGYSGHMPMSSVNDRGIPRPNCLDTQGESF